MSKRAALGALPLIWVLSLAQCSILGRGAPSLLEEDPAVTTSLSDVVTDVAVLDAFTPRWSHPMTVLPRGGSGEFILDRRGVFEFNAQSYCLHAGKHGPGSGEGYAYAPLRGRHAEIVRNVLRRSSAHPEIPQNSVQALLWAILSRSRMGELPDLLLPSAQQLLTPEEIATLNADALGMLKRAALEAALATLPAHLREVAAASAHMRELLTVADATYGALEEVAVLSGDPSYTEGSRQIPVGRWSYDLGGYFVRYFPSGYSRTRIELYVPGSVTIQRDEVGRIMALTDDTGNRLEVSYDADIAPLLIHGDAELRGHAFKKLRFACRLPPPAEEPWFSEWDGIGWTFVGGYGQSATWGEPQLTGVGDRFTGWGERLESARRDESNVRDFARWLESTDRAAVRTALETLFDLKQLERAVAEATQLDQYHSEIAEFRTCAVLTERASTSLVGSLIEESYDQPGSAATEANHMEFDPAEHVAVPGNTGRQRLAQSGREESEDEPCPCSISIGPPPELEYVACDGSYSPVVTAHGPTGGQNYQWTIVAGSSRVSIIGSTSRYYAQLKLLSPSDDRNDVTVGVSYSRNDRTCSCRRSFSVLRPDGARVEVEETHPAALTDGVWRMSTHRRYQTLDQFGAPLQIPDMAVEEILTGIDSEGTSVSWSIGERLISINPDLADAPAVEILAKATITFVDGQFPDTPDLSKTGPDPFWDELDFNVEQEMFVAGCRVRDNTLHFLPLAIRILP